MILLETIVETEKVLTQLGLPFWADKLRAIKAEYEPNIENEIAQKVISLFGGWGSLNDNAFSDADAPNGLSGEEATKCYFDAINKLT